VLRTVGLLALAAVLVGCGGGDDRRQAAAEYLQAANRAQAAFRPAFEQAGVALQEYAAEGGPTATTAAELRDAYSALIGAREALSLVEPPEEARSLHNDLRRLLDVQARLALELSLVSTYLPAADAALRPSQDGGRALAQELERADTAEEQRAALRAYARSVGRSLEALDGLAPPPLLRPWHDGERDRLQASRRLALDVAAATEGGDREAIERALKAFEEAASDPASIRLAQAAAVRSFNRQVDQQLRLVARIAGAQAELEELGR
jgi:hypothetical protein